MTDSLIISNETQTLVSEVEKVTTLVSESGGSLGLVVSETETVIVNEGDRITTIVTPASQGPQGPKGDTVLVSSISPKPTGEVIQAFRVVILNENGIAMLADSSNLAHVVAVYGVSLEGATQGEYVPIQAFGEVVNPAWDWTPQAPIYLGNNGQIIQGEPADGFILILGRAISRTMIFVNIGQAIIL